MSIQTVEFADFERKPLGTRTSLLNHLAPEFGKAYVVTITRDGCSACERQKPKLNHLAEEIATDFKGRVVFTRIHVKQPFGSTDESLRSKDLLGHYFYPTNLILLKTGDRGAIEYYRNVSPEMTEIRKNIKTAIEIATAIEREVEA